MLQSVTKILKHAFGFYRPSILILFIFLRLKFCSAADQVWRCASPSQLCFWSFSRKSVLLQVQVAILADRKKILCANIKMTMIVEKKVRKATKLPPFPSSILIHLGSNCVKLEMRFGRGCNNDTEVGLVDFCVDDKYHICFCTSDYCNFVNVGPSANILLIIITLFHVYQTK